MHMDRSDRDLAIEIAARFCNHTWTPTASNAYHGPDDQGVPVETPDISLRTRHPGLGWWIPNEMNTGIPYKGGGYDNIEGFDVGIVKGLFAGDIWIDPARKKLPESKCAVGLDCSGFISRCWELTEKQSTRSLIEKGVCYPLGGLGELQKGDILLRSGSHAFLFYAFDEGTVEHCWVYDVGNQTGRVSKRQIDLVEMGEKGFRPFSRPR